MNSEERARWVEAVKQRTEEILARADDPTILDRCEKIEARLVRLEAAMYGPAKVSKGDK